MVLIWFAQFHGNRAARCAQMCVCMCVYVRIGTKVVDGWYRFSRLIVG